MKCLRKVINLLVIISRLATVTLGTVGLGLGVFSHLKSDWTRDFDVIFDDQQLGDGHFHDICTNKTSKEILKKLGHKCPDIILEYYFIYVMITCLCLSYLVGLIDGFVVDLRIQQLKFLDLTFHLVAAILLLIAGALYIVSAEQIDILFKENLLEGHFSLNPPEGFQLDLRREEKLTAGGITIGCGVVYGVAAVLIGIR